MQRFGHFSTLLSEKLSTELRSTEVISCGSETLLNALRQAVRNTSRRTHADQSIVCDRRQKMRNLTGIFGLALATLLWCCCSELTKAAPYPAEVPSNPVLYKRFVRHRPSVEHPELEVYEVRELYYVRRATLPPSTTALPKKKKIIRLADGDIERRIRCDFNPNLAECE